MMAAVSQPLHRRRVPSALAYVAGAVVGVVLSRTLPGGALAAVVVLCVGALAYFASEAWRGRGVAGPRRTLTVLLSLLIGLALSRIVSGLWQ
jgi:hypothetical protein